MKSIIKTGSLITMTVAPIAAVVSCGVRTNNNNYQITHHWIGMSSYTASQYFKDAIEMVPNPKSRVVKSGDWTAGTGRLDATRYDVDGFTFEVLNNGHLSYGTNVEIRVIPGTETSKERWTTAANLTVRSVDPTTTGVHTIHLNIEPSDHHEDNQKIHELLNTEIKAMPWFSFNFTSTTFSQLERDKKSIDTKTWQASGWINSASASEIAQIPSIKSAIAKYNNDAEDYLKIRNVLNAIDHLSDIDGFASYTPPTGNTDVILTDIQGKLANSTKDGVSLSFTAEKDAFNTIWVSMKGVYNGKDVTRKIQYIPPVITDSDEMQIQRMNENYTFLTSQMNDEPYPSFTFPSYIHIPSFDRDAVRASINAKVTQSKASHDLAEVTRLYNEVANLMQQLKDDAINQARGFHIFSQLISMNSLSEIFDVETSISSLKPTKTTLMPDEITALVNAVNNFRGGSLSISLQYDSVNNKIAITYNILGVTGTKQLTLTE